MKKQDDAMWWCGTIFDLQCVFNRELLCGFVLPPGCGAVLCWVKLRCVFMHEDSSTSVSLFAASGKCSSSKELSSCPSDLGGGPIIFYLE